MAHEATHTLDLPDGNRTPDADVVAWATRHDAVVVTKDSDVVRHFILSGKLPLLLASTGNILNAALQSLLVADMPAVAYAFRSARFIELTRSSLIVHRSAAQAQISRRPPHLSAARRKPRLRQT